MLVHVIRKVVEKSHFSAKVFWNIIDTESKYITVLIKVRESPK